MRQGLLIASCVASLALSPTAQGQTAQAVFFDGGSKITATTDPYFTPAAGSHYGMIEFLYSSIGQINWGYVEIYEAEFKSDNYVGSIQIQLNDSTEEHGDCPYFVWWINNIGPLEDSAYAGQWEAEKCDIAPDPTLYNSGRKMSLQIWMASDTGLTDWLYAVAKDVLPQDGQWYDVQIYYSTGSYGDPPRIRYIVIPIGNPGGGTLADADRIDSSWFYEGAPTGWDVQLKNMIWQVGCQSADSSYADTCYTGALARIFHYPSDQPVIPYGTQISVFITSTGYASNLGIDCSGPFGFPPEVCLEGNDLTFNTNLADIASGGPVQTYTSEGLQNSSNPNYNFLGQGLTTHWNDPF
jgi:hypothetical protein